jgi:hypothetical protein
VAPPFTQFISNQWGGPGIFGRYTAWDIAEKIYGNATNVPDPGAVGSNPEPCRNDGSLTWRLGDHSHTASTTDAAHHTHTVSVSRLIAVRE